MTKVLHKHVIRSNDRLKIDRLRKLIERIEGLIDPGSKAKPEQIKEELFKFLEFVPELLGIFPRVEREYQMAYAAGEAATSLMAKKGRVAMSLKFSESNAQRYYKWIDKFAHSKTYELNKSAMNALREQARQIVDFEGKVPFRKGHWISQNDKT